MKLMISPTKKMRQDPHGPAPRDLPLFLDRAEALAARLGNMDYGALKKLLGCNDQIAQLNFQRYAAMDLRRNLTPALLAYDGIQYKYMAPGVFTTEMYGYVQDHLWILSGLYGALRPLDGVAPYRLEMGARLDLYRHWGDSLARALGEGPVVNLASEEYARAVTPYRDDCISVVFGQLVGDKVVEKGVYVKMARGEMVRYLAQRAAADPQEMRGFDQLGYRFSPERSTEASYVFIQGEPQGK